MLMQIREKATGIIAYIIIILIAIPFAFWGIHEYLSGTPDTVVAEVNGEEINKRFFDFRLQQQRRSLRSLLGNSFDTLYADESKLKRDVLDGIVEGALLDNITRTNGYRISDKHVFDRIRQAPEFQVDGRFNRERYEQLIAAQNENTFEIEQRLRQQERVQQYQTSVAVSSFLPNAAKVDYANLKNQKRQFDYFIVEAVVDANEITQQEIADYYHTNQQAFQTKPQVKLEYIEIVRDDIASTLDFSEDEVLDFYDEEIDRYRTAELRNPNHILFKLDQSATEEQVTAAFEKATAALKRIKAGESFATVAEEISEDTSSAKRGGNLGPLARTDINNEEFIDKLFAMEVDEVSEPIRTRLGVQIIELTEITPGEQKSFEDVKDEVLEALRADAAENEYYKQQETLQDLAYQAEDNLELAAEGLGRPTQTSDWISALASAGIGSYPKVINVAFSEALLDRGENSELLELEEGRVAVVRVVDREDASTIPINELEDDIKNTLTFKRKAESSLKLGQNLLGELANDSSLLEQLAEDNNFVLEKVSPVLRLDNSVNSEILEHVFRIPSTADMPRVTGLQLEEGKYAVVRLNDITDPEVESALPEFAEWNATISNYGRRELTAINQALRETEEVKIFEENL